MKYFTTLLVAVAFASTAAAATPEARVLPLQPRPTVAVTEQITATVQSRVAGDNLPVLQLQTVKNPAKIQGGLTYSSPAMFGTGLTSERRGWIGIVRNGAYNEYTWSVNSTEDAPFTWTFDEQTFEGNNLTVTPEFGFYDYPTVTNVNGASYVETAINGENTYPTQFMSGGNMGNYGMDEAGITTGQRPNSNCQSFTGGELAYPISDDLKDLLIEQLGVTDAQMVGYSAFFEKPASPYYVTKFWAWVYQEIEGNSLIPVTVTITEIDENGYLTDNVIASGETVINATTAASEMIEIDLNKLDEEGLETDEPITISTAVLVELSGFAGSPGLNMLNPVFNGGTYTTIEEYQAGTYPYRRHAYLNIETTSDDGVEVGMYLVPWPYGSGMGNDYLTLMYDMWFMLDATFAWGFPADGVYEISIPDEGGEVEVAINSYWLPTAYSMTIPADADADWINGVSGYESTEDGNVYFVFDTQALPSDIEGRTLPITFDAPGIKPFTLTLKQGTAAISGVEADKAIRSLEYYDVMGRKLNAAPDNGLFIEKATMTDGSVKATKINR